ncbi:MAG: response regulator [Nitrospirae bacterium]|nr:response regulator [Nitrospirota bacterium]
MNELDKQQSILVIDDEELSCRMLKSVLADNGYAVETANSGIIGIDRACSLLPDAILLDIFMPEMDGIRVCGILRELPETRHIPIICMTGSEATDLKIRCLEAGANEFVVKPIEPLELLMRIKNLLILRHYASVAEENRALREYRRTEEQLKRFIDSSQDMVFRTDTTGTFTLMNQAGAEILGFRSVSEILGGKAADYWRSPEDRTRMVETIMRDGIVKAYPIPAKKADGTLIDLEATSRIMEDEQGNFAGIEGIIRDVTERNGREREMQRQKENLQVKHQELNDLFTKVESVKKEWESSFDATGDMIIIVDSRGLIKRCNRTFMVFADRTYEGLLLKDWDSVLDEIGFKLNAMYQNSSELFHEKSNRWFQLTAHPFRDVDNLEGNIMTIHDTTELKNISSALEITNRQIEQNRVTLQNALDEISELIHQVTFKKDFSVRFANPNLRRCHDLMNCKKTSCPCYGKDAERCWQIAGTYCGGRVQGAFTEKFDNCSECPTYQFATSDPIYQIGESFNNMMHILELQHAEIERAYNELKVAQSQITQQEKMASIGQLAAGVAHEINNPTGFIMSNLGSFQKYVDKLLEFMEVQTATLAQLPAEQTEELQKKRRALKVDFITEDIKCLVKESLDGAERIKKIVQDLKSFSRVDEAEQKMADINAGIESTINIVWNELKYKATVQKEYGDIPRTKCNPGQLNQVFMNMLVNAAHAIDKQGEIKIKTWAEDGTIKVTITDTGSGIPADKVNRIFEPFFTTKEVGKGTGLGLSIAYDIVKKHKGEILVESEEGRGTTFTVKIPIIEG